MSDTGQAGQAAMTALAAELKTAAGGVKALGDEIRGRMEKGERLAEGLKEQADAALTGMNALSARLDALEQKQARKGGEPGQTGKSLGELLTASAQFAQYKADPRQGNAARVHVKAGIDSAAGEKADVTGGDGSGGALVEAHRLTGIVAAPMQRLTIRDLLSAGRTASNAITYIREGGFWSRAAAVEEQQTKPRSAIAFSEVTVSVKTIAHWIRASRQILDDAPMLQSYIDERLTYGLKLVEEKQLLSGDGKGPNLSGILPAAAAFADPAGLAEYTIIDQLRLAMLQAVLAEYPATGHVLNPIDWTKIETSKDSLGRYIIGNPRGVAAPTLWGLPVVATPAIAAGTFLTGAFRLGAQLFDRWDLSVAVSTQNEDDFIKNMVTVLCEERLALAIYRPEAFITGKLSGKTGKTGK